MATDVDRRTTLPGRRQDPEIRHVRQARAGANRSVPHASKLWRVRPRPSFALPPLPPLRPSRKDEETRKAEPSGWSDGVDDRERRRRARGGARPRHQPRPRACMLAAAACCVAGPAPPCQSSSVLAAHVTGRQIPADASPESDANMLARSPARAPYLLRAPTPRPRLLHERSKLARHVT